MVIKVKDYNHELNGGLFAKFSRTCNECKLQPFATIIWDGVKLPSICKEPVLKILVS